MTTNKIHLTEIPAPTIFENIFQTTLTDETINERKNKLLTAMSEHKIDTLIVYADKEHGSNFEYLAGFIPRFEEGLLVLKRNGQAYLILGNENMKMAEHARIENTAIHCPYFSLPNQPMDNDLPLEVLFGNLAIQDSKKIGIVGWKLFTSNIQNNQKTFDIPHYILEGLTAALPENTELINATNLFIDGKYGVRVTNNANEIAHYEYGANLASTCMLKAMNAIEIGKSETEIGQLLSAYGQPHSVVTIAATGQRFEDANLYPSNKEIKLKDKMSLTTGFKGGLASRGGYAVSEKNELPTDQQDYLDRLVFPYYTAVTTWLETIKIGITGNELYQSIETIFPKKDYHWHLNPGHFVSDEEWMSSPIFDGSTVTLKSGMMFQIDIIPSIEGYAGTSVEECIAIADKDLQQQIQSTYPELWMRIQARRNYLQTQLGIKINEELLPLSNTVGYLRPFLLNKKMALANKKQN